MDRPRPSVNRRSGEDYELLRRNALAYAAGIDIALEQEGQNVDDVARNLIREAYEAGYMQGQASPHPLDDPDTTA